MCSKLWAKLSSQHTVLRFSGACIEIPSPDCSENTLHAGDFLHQPCVPCKINNGFNKVTVMMLQAFESLLGQDGLEDSSNSNVIRVEDTGFYLIELDHPWAIYSGLHNQGIL